MADARLVLKNAHVIDPSLDVDALADVAIADGKIAAVGDVAPHPDDRTIDCSGSYLSPGWVDIHVHAYGRLGFADPDSIGIYQGVTSFVEAGGPGIGTFDEFLAMMDTQTRLYAGMYLRPLGILGLNALEGNVRNLGEIPFRRWLDCMDEHRDIIRYLKVGAFDLYGAAPIKIGKGLSEILEIPMYVHTGDFRKMDRPWEPLRAAFDIAGEGDIITHIYHQNFGHILDENDRVLPAVWDAARRGVKFDIGFGGNNFAWDLAEKAFAQGVVPDVISSDLQQFNVTSPTYSLANVMGVLHRLGLSLRETIACVTHNAARSIKLDDRAGSLAVGMPADITIFNLEAGEFALADGSLKTRIAERRFVPLMAFKDGQRFDADMERCQDERNWFMEVIEDRIPEAVERFSLAQREFLAALAAELRPIEWQVTEAKDVDLEVVAALQAAVHRAIAARPLPLGDALRAVYGCFIERSFAVQVGLFIIRLERPFVFERLAAATEVAGAVA